MNQWLSFTTTFVAPAASAPSMAALASPVISRRKRPYSAAWAGSAGVVWGFGGRAGGRSFVAWDGEVAVAGDLVGRRDRGARHRGLDDGAQGVRGGRPDSLGAGPALLAELPHADGRGRPVDGGAVPRQRVACAARHVAPAVRHRVRDRRRVFGAGRAGDGAVLHDRRRRGAARTAGLGQLVPGGRLRRPAHRVRRDHRTEVRWLNQERYGNRRRGGRPRAASAPCARPSWTG